MVMHLTKGSVLPPKSKVLRLYSMIFCPYAQRVRLVLAAKNITYDTVNVNLQNKPDWLFELNPEGKVPVLDTGSEIITESTVIADYLDEKYPYPPLYPKDNTLKQIDKQLISTYQPIISNFMKLIWNKENQTITEHVQILQPDIKALENVLHKRQGVFLGGSFPKMVDYMIWPWVERAQIVPFLYEKQELPFSLDVFPNIYSWYHNMRMQDAVKKTEIDIQGHRKFVEMRRQDSTIDYDKLYLMYKL